MEITLFCDARYGVGTGYDSYAYFRYPCLFPKIDSEQSLMRLSEDYGDLIQPKQ